MKRYLWKARDGKEISVVEWTVEQPQAIVQISHGMAEHVMRYDRIARRLNEAGYLVFGDDHRCFGHTDEAHQGYTEGDNWEKTLSDLVGLTDRYREKYPGVPVVLFGHSYGSFLAQGYLEGNSDRLAGAILCGSSYMRDPSVGFGAFVAGLFCCFGGAKKKANLIKKLTFDQYDKRVGEGYFLSSILAECERYAADPYCGCVCTNAFYRYFFRGLKTLYRKESVASLDPRLPLLLIAGEDDPVGDMGAGMRKLEQFYRTQGFDAVELKLFPHCRHEILNDTCREEADRTIEDFLRRIAEEV